MYKANITQAKNAFSQLLDRVRHGQTIIIMDRQCPVARLTPIVNGNASQASVGRIQRLERAGWLIPSRHDTLPKSILAHKPPSTENTASAVQALLDNRANER